MTASPPVAVRPRSSTADSGVPPEADTSRPMGRNFVAFIWHALFLAFVTTFIDVNTVLSAFILTIGGTSLHVGLLTAISIGLPLATQLLFAGFLAGRPRKKPYLLAGIYLRVAALAGMGCTLSLASSADPGRMLLTVFFWIGLFSVSGAFAGISYTDILGKVLPRPQRRRFLVVKQSIAAIGMIAAAVAARHLFIAMPYPRNYTAVFLTASALLTAAAGGFWIIRERPGRSSGHPGTLATLRAIPRTLAADRNLIFYVLLLNTAGLGLTLVPFYVALAKARFGLASQQVGTFLLLQFLGMALSTPIWNWVGGRWRFKGIAAGGILLGSVLPWLAIGLAAWGADRYRWLFFLGGCLVSAGKIALDGILLEITTDDNRAVYTGISGSLSLTTVFFPILAGGLIDAFGFTAVLLLASPLVAAAGFFLGPIVCAGRR